MTNDPFGVTAFDGKEGERLGWVEGIDLPGEPVFQKNRVFFAQAVLEIREGGDALDEFLLEVSVPEVFGGNSQEHLLFCFGRGGGGFAAGWGAFDVTKGLLEFQANDLDLVHGCELKSIERQRPKEAIGRMLLKRRESAIELVGTTRGSNRVTCGFFHRLKIALGSSNFGRKFGRLPPD